MQSPIPPRTTHASARKPQRILVTAMALALLAASSGVAATTAADATEAPSPAASEPQFWSDVLEVGDCIIRPPEGELPEPIPCEGLHEEEIYAIGRLDVGPDEPYPGDDVIADMAGNELCDEATLGFGGETWTWCRSPRIASTRSSQNGQPEIGASCARPGHPKVSP